MCVFLIFIFHLTNPIINNYACTLQSSIRVVCALLSLPTPPNFVNPAGDENGANPSYPEHKALCKLLLLGDTKSGTSTIYKQVRIHWKLYGVTCITHLLLFMYY